MEQTLGRRIAELRRKKNMTQEDLARALDISSQAISKWENDQSCPDISILPKVADLLGVSVDQLLRGEQEPQTRMIQAENKKPVDQMIMRIVVNSADGDRVRVNLPLAIVNAGVNIGSSMGVMGDKADALSQVDFAQILSMAHMGIVGKLVEVESADGDQVEIWVE